MRIISPAGLPGPSGGTIYNQRLAQHWDVDVEWLQGGWPYPSNEDVHLLSHALMPSGVHPAEPVLLDGLIGCAAPEVLRQACAAGATIVLIVHLPLPAETGLTQHEVEKLAASEAAALACASAVVATSQWAADDLFARYGLAGVHVAEPGTMTSALAEGSTPPRVVTLAAYSARKNHSLLIEALGHRSLETLEWTALWAGADPTGDSVSTTADAVNKAGLASRVSVCGPVFGDDLATIWHEADLLLLPSHAETYAMVVAEALACGVPAIVGAGTGAADTLRGPGEVDRMPGLALPTDDPYAWSLALHEWLTSASLRRRWREAALRRRTHLPSWERSSATIARVMRTSLAGVA